mmetsp:Transcript_19498/g.58966  ORF Transcript_19498/g.58966 Transcript_19498/m.58966 type:complete len:222 (+) Transcript_19498:2-667(+)
MELELKKSLQQEVLAAKARWAEQIKLSKAPSSSPSAPLPIGVCRRIPRPASAEAYDVEEIIVQLRIDGPTAAPGCVRVDVKGEAMPAAVQEAASARVLELWEGILTKYQLCAPTAGGPFAVERVLAWCETKYTDLCSIKPELVEAYDGVNENGVTIRRFTLIEPREGSPSESEESGESSSEGEEESEDESQSEGMTEDERCGAQSCWLRKACASIGEVRGR